MSDIDDKRDAVIDAMEDVKKKQGGYNEMLVAGMAAWLNFASSKALYKKNKKALNLIYYFEKELMENSQFKIDVNVYLGNGAYESLMKIIDEKGEILMKNAKEKAGLCKVHGSMMNKCSGGRRWPGRSTKRRRRRSRRKSKRKSTKKRRRKRRKRTKKRRRKRRR